jgi:hypothetical protein
VPDDRRALPRSVHGRRLPRALNDPRWQKDLAPDIVQDIRDSLKNLRGLPYFTLVRRRIPDARRKFKQIRETGVTLLVGTDSGVPGNFHTDSTWRELDTWVKLGMTPMQAISGATRWPAAWLKKEKDIGTLAPGRYADVHRGPRGRPDARGSAPEGGRRGQERRARALK